MNEEQQLLGEPADRPAETALDTPGRAADDAPKKSGSGLGALWFFVGMSLLVLSGAFAAWLLMVKPAQNLASSLKNAAANALAAITGQQVSISSNTVTLAKTNITELNVVQRRTQTVTKMETTYFGSKATLILRGDFVVKAGFDLTKPFSIEVDEATGEVRANFPPAKVTSVELKDYEVFFSDNGVLNRITPELQQTATQQMIAQARLDAEKSDIRREAEAQLNQRLRDLLAHDAKKVLVEGMPPPPVLP